MHDRHEVHVLMAVQVQWAVFSAELAEAGHLRLDLLMELTGDSLTPRVPDG